jgi:hypothetical protein
MICSDPARRPSLVDVAVWMHVPHVLVTCRMVRHPHPHPQLDSQHDRVYVCVSMRVYVCFGVHVCVCMRVCVCVCMRMQGHPWINGPMLNPADLAVELQRRKAIVDEAKPRQQAKGNTPLLFMYNIYECQYQHPYKQLFVSVARLNDLCTRFFSFVLLSLWLLLLLLF